MIANAGYIADAIGADRRPVAGDDGPGAGG